MKPWHCFLMTALLAAGCKENLFPNQSAPTTQAAASQPAAAEKPPGSFITFVQMKMLVLQLPTGTISRSQDVWSYLNEEPILSAYGTMLTDNGVRIGIGKTSDWPELAAILTHLSGRELGSTDVVLRPDASTPINLRQDLPMQTIFLYDRNHALGGADYPPGDNVLMMTGDVNLQDMRTVELTATFAIRESQRQTQYQPAPEGYTFAAPQRVYTLPGMQFRLRVPSGSILFIAPSSQAQRSSSPGNRFLLREREGITFETVLVLIPQAMSAPLKERP